MDYYTNAHEQMEGAMVLANAQKYRLAVTLLCLSCELFLKSLAERKNPASALLDSHDIVGLGYLIREDIDYPVIAPQLTFIRKYLNDSRYPFDTKIYTKKFYEDCLNAVLAVKKAVDLVNANKSSMELLRERFGKEHVTNSLE